MRVPRQGWRYFLCESCGRHWREASRDCASPSGDGCTCGEWVSPYDRKADKELEVDRFGNLIITEEL